VICALHDSRKTDKNRSARRLQVQASWERDSVSSSAAKPRRHHPALAYFGVHTASRNFTRQASRSKKGSDDFQGMKSRIQSQGSLEGESKALGGSRTVDGSLRGS